MTELHYATLLETAAAIRARKLSPVALTRALVERIAHLEPSLQAYATLTPDLALAQAARAEEEIAAGRYRGPLHGIPIAVKDICDTAGIVTAAGTALHRDRVPALDATVVKRLTNAGAVLLGKLQLTEGAFVTHHPTVTPPRNPWHADYYAGASSSGSGVAVAAGLCFGALGSDTGGSIRFPSAANGITGLKPTWGRVSRYGVFALADSLDHIGPMTRSAADAGAMLGVIAGLDPEDPTSLPAPVPDYLAGLGGQLGGQLDGIRIGVDAAYNEEDCDPDVVAAVRDAERVLRGLGATITAVRVPPAQAVTEAWATLCAVEAAIVHETTYPARASEYGGLAQLLETGRAADAVDVMKAHHGRLAYAGALTQLFASIDLLLIPTQPLSDFTIAQEAELFATAEGLLGFLRFAAPFDMWGGPTLTLPGGFTARGMPLSFQLVARHLDEPLLVRAGDAFQRATDWHRRHPAL
ncbi:putative amidase AmiD [Aliidongia dinghuensis]|uniref:Putative amidase AmiD n=1 Tax=Aliidongia dinghuensis TaxID=1867774 RepID=A0A8J3E1D7_9PROT|nr:amidase [Aliidongia dinghuensis]GGE99048.1 putative amidase AmiD [Aliidongia dinghuensis]